MMSFFIFKTIPVGLMLLGMWPPWVKKDLTTLSGSEEAHTKGAGTVASSVVRAEGRLQPREGSLLETLGRSAHSFPI